MDPSSQLQWNIQPQIRRKRRAILFVRVAPKLKEQKDIYCELKITLTPEHLSYDSGGSVHSAIRSVLVAAQCFSIMPVHGITSDNTADLRFRWLSFRSLYTYCTVSLALLTTIIYCLQLTQTGLTFNNSLYTAFSTSTLLTLLLFLQLAPHWPLLIRKWEEVEKKTQMYYRKTNLKLRFNLYTGIVLLLALVEHVLANTRAIAKALHCADNGFLGVMRAYFIYNYHFVFVLTGYSHWKGFLLAIMNIIKTFSWSYMDLFIMLISIALADHFQALNQYLITVPHKMQTQIFWRQVREHYNMFATLTRAVDCCLSKIVLLSFGSNLYFVCFQLLNSMRPLRDFNEAVYFYWSIIYLLLKVCVVSLCAASIHDQSKEPKTALYSVPTENYCTEVQRFLVQLTTDDVALTGLNFFSVTRTFLMSVAGTIVTYEVVLLQFNMASEMPPIPAPSSTNTTEECQWLSSVEY